MKPIIRFVLLVFCVVTLAYVQQFHSFPLSEEVEKWGQVGDYFGGLLNPVISAGTLFVAVAVWQLQKNELSATQNELRIQRGQQRFFDMLNVYYRTVDLISSSYIRTINKLASDPIKSMNRGDGLHEELGSEHITLTGKAALARKREMLEAGEPDGYLIEGYPTINWKNTVDSSINLKSPENIESLTLLKNEWTLSQSTLVLSHYFRTLLFLLKESEFLLGSEEHRRYVALFVAQLSDDELTLIAYYLWLDPHGADLLPMAKQYSLLQNMPTHSKETFTAVLPLAVFTT